MVGQDLEGLRVLDAFGGSGLLGLEAWSRGAQVTIVERRAHVARAIQDTAQALGADVEVVPADVLQVAPTLGPWDGILADPPYAIPPDRFLDALASAATSWLVYESDQRTVAPPHAGGLVLDRSRRFGSTILWLYRAKDGT